MSDGRLLGDLTKATGQGSLGWVCPPGCASSKGRFGPVVSFITREVDCSPRGVGLRADAPHSSGSEDPASVAVLTGGGMTGCGQGGGLASNHEEANPSGGKRSSESMRCGGRGDVQACRAGKKRAGCRSPLGSQPWIQEFCPKALPGSLGRRKPVLLQLK